MDVVNLSLSTWIWCAGSDPVYQQWRKALRALRDQRNLFAGSHPKHTLYPRCKVRDAALAQSCNPGKLHPHHPIG